MGNTGGIPKGLTHRRRQLVGQLWLRGNSERAIAEMVQMEASKPNSLLKGCDKTTHVTVHLDVAACKEDWIKRDGRKLGEIRSEQIARLLDIVHQSWVDFSNKAEYLRPQYLRIALDGEEKLAKILGTLAPTKLTGGEGEPLVPPIIEYHFPDGTVMKPPRNGHNKEKAIEVLSRDHDGNGNKPAQD